MYISSDADQITMEDFFMPFGGKLLKTNRWVKLASMMPWVMSRVMRKIDFSLW